MSGNERVLNYILKGDSERPVLQEQTDVMTLGE